MANDTQVTVLVKGSDELHIRFSRRRGKVQKEVRYQGNVEARSTTTGDLTRYRMEIRGSVRAGYVIRSTDQNDLRRA